MPPSFIKFDISIGLLPTGCSLVGSTEYMSSSCGPSRTAKNAIIDSFLYIERTCHTRIAYSDGTVKGSHSAAALGH